MAVALYARVSTPRQAEKDLSIPDQLRQLREYCKAQNLADRLGVRRARARARPTTGARCSSR